jgi:segregation and condensation protein A
MEKSERIGQEQLYDMLLSKELSWQEIIYDLIASEQLDPWDIDLALLASSYLTKLRELEEANFFISSKVLLAASILLRIKSEMLLSRYMRSLDEILFGKPSIEGKPVERIILDEELPELFPKTPLPRLKKVSLQELMQALDRAIVTEQRRIRKEIANKQAMKHVAVVLPKFRINIRDKIREIYSKIKDFFKREPQKKLTFTLLAGTEKNERIATFVPLLHLDTQSRILLEQQNHFDEIYIWLKKHEAEQIEKIENLSPLDLQNEKSMQEIQDTDKAGSRVTP